jgi:UPF0716 family protein affecting phage T7 exclusion
MNKPAINMETLKFAGGAIIVGAAALIMFPGFLSVALGLWRILVIMVVAGGGCLLIANITQRILKRKRLQRSTTAIEPAREADQNLT